MKKLGKIAMSSTVMTGICKLNMAGKLAVLFVAAAMVFGLASCKNSADETEKTVAVTGITLNKTELTLTAGGKETLTATVKPDNATDKTVTWTSDKTGIATVSAGGEVTAVAKGSTTITATAGGKSATCTVTVNPVTYPVTVTGGTATPAAAEAGATVMIAANEPETGKVFDGWTTESDVSFADASNAITTFTMPAKAVSVTATYKDIVYIGSKKPSEAKEVGDIVFTDGSAMAYSDFAALDDEAKNAKKTSAIALIFYKGTELNSGDDTTTSRTLGVGLKHAGDKSFNSGPVWCTTSAAAYRKIIPTIRCEPSGSGPNYEFVDATASDRNGSDNLKQIAVFLEAADGVEDDTATAENYPAFYYAKNYKDVEGSNVSGTDYEAGWYLPSIAELSKLYVNGKGESKKFDIDTASKALGGNKFIQWYWSSSQKRGDNYVHVLNFSTGGGYGSGEMTNQYHVCCIRAF